MKFPQVWDLERFFEGGSNSQSFQNTYKETKIKLSSLESLLKSSLLFEALNLSQEVSLTLREMEAFVDCLLSQNTHDTKARILESNLRKLLTVFSNLTILFDETLKNLPDQAFETLIQNHQELSFPLQEKRTRSKVGFVT